MKSKVKVKKVKPQPSSEYPKLMINIVYRNIVLFSNSTTGVIVDIGELNPEDYKIGDYNNKYAPDCFEKFYGSVTLKN